MSDGQSRTGEMIAHGQALCIAEAPFAPAAESQSAHTFTLSDEQHATILESFNETSICGLPECSVHELIEKTARAYPDRLAASQGEDSLTYGELLSRSTEVASWLISQSVEPQSVIALLMNRGLDTLPTILGILKAGCAWLPMDPSHPDGHLHFIVQDSRAELVITDHRNAARIPSRCAPSFSFRSITGGDSDAVLPSVDADSLAYVMYTSGSTGKPKGVRILHQNLAHYSLHHAAMCELSSDDRVIQFSSPGFDISIEETIPPLIAGAQIVMREEVVPGPAGMNEFIERNRITTFSPSTAFWHEWTMALEAEDLPVPECLRLVVVGGEKASPEVARVWLSRTPSESRLLNSYGPTETTVCVSAYEVTMDDVRNCGDAIPIGKPYSAARIYVLDEARQPVPTGTPGEIYIGGSTVGDSYINRPQLTASRFAADPFVADADARMYRTGDLGHWRADGNLMISGRIDSQMKIGGFRVEPTEIAVQLESLPTVRQAHVSARETNGRKQLVAWVVLADESVAASTLREELSRRVPSYAVPASIVLVERLPLTINGKVDTRRLPAPEIEAEEFRVSNESMTETERKVARLFSQLLGTPVVRAHNSFFALGGTSLQVMQLAVEVEKTLNEKLPLVTMLENPTVGGVAAALDNACDNEEWVPIQAMRSEGTRPPLFFVPEITGDPFRLKELAAHLADDQPFYAMKAPGYLEGQRPFDNMKELAAEFLQQVKRISPRGPYYLGGFCFGAAVAYEMAQQLQSQGEEVALLAIVEFEMEDSPYQHIPLRRPLTFLRAACNAPGWIRQLVAFLGVKWLVRESFSKLGNIVRRILPASESDEDRSLRENLDLPAELRAIPDQHAAVWRCHLKALEEYRSEPYDGRLTFLYANVRPLRYSLTPIRHWKELCGGNIDARAVPGFHQRILHSPNVERLAETLTVCLNESQRNNNAIA